MENNAALTESADEKRESSALPLVKFLLFLLFITAVSVLFLKLRGKPLMDPEWVVEWLEDFGKNAPIIFIILYSLRPLILFPASILSVAGGMIFGAVDSTVYSVMGGTIGAVIAFFISRFFGKEFIDRTVGKHLRNIDMNIGEEGFKIIFILRIMPVIPFDLVNYGAGLTTIRTRDYILGTFLGLIPSSFVYAFLGSSMSEIRSWKFFQAILIFILLLLVTGKYKSGSGRVK